MKLYYTHGKKDKRDEYIKYNELEDAKTEGIKESKLEIAKNMLKEKIDKEDISKATGLTLKDIQKLQSTGNKPSTFKIDINLYDNNEYKCY